MGFEDEYDNDKRNNWVINIGIGRGPSGPSIEGPFCCAVYLCRALEDRKKARRKKEKKRKRKEK